jgi:haloacetate dehalogenase
MTLFERADATLLPRFERRHIDAGDGEILTLTCGSGPPLLMLHGDPQTHLCWHRIAPALAQDFTVVLTDIRGRGESHKVTSQGGEAYSKRIMAAEQVAVMEALGHECFALVGHDRGARVARRLALDHPDRVSRLAVMDVVPALDLYDAMTAELAQEYFYFHFLTQPSPIPERLIAGDPQGFLRLILQGLSDRKVPYDPVAMDAYMTANAEPEAVAAMCECFRAGFEIDRIHDRADREAGRRIACPTLVMWGERGVIARHFDVRGVWSRWCEDVRFAPMPSGHFIPEEAPGKALEALMEFLSIGKELA